MEPSRSSALVGLCATGGAVAVLSSAGLVPAIGLAVGLGGGWLLGQKLKGKAPAKPQAGTPLYEEKDFFNQLKRYEKVREIQIYWLYCIYLEDPWSLRGNKSETPIVSGSGPARGWWIRWGTRGSCPRAWGVHGCRGFGPFLGPFARTRSQQWKAWWPWSANYPDRSPQGGSYHQLIWVYHILSCVILKLQLWLSAILSIFSRKKKKKTSSIINGSSMFFSYKNLCSRRVLHLTRCDTLSF